MIGITKEVDKLGRIVIPKKYRERYGLDSYVEIVATESGILLKNPEYILIKRNANIIGNDNASQNRK